MVKMMFKKLFILLKVRKLKNETTKPSQFVPMQEHEEVLKENEMLKEELNKAKKTIDSLKKEVSFLEGKFEIMNLQIGKLMLHSSMPREEKRKLEEEVNELHTKLIFSYGRQKK